MTAEFGIKIHCSDILSLSLSSIIFLLIVTQSLCIHFIIPGAFEETGNNKKAWADDMADFEYVNPREAKQDTGPKPPLDLSYHFSRQTVARKESSIKRFYQYFQIPGIGNLAGGEFNSIYSCQEWGIHQHTIKLTELYRSAKCSSIPFRYPRSPDRTA